MALANEAPFCIDGGTEDTGRTAALANSSCARDAARVYVSASLLRIYESMHANQAHTLCVDVNQSISSAAEEGKHGGNATGEQRQPVHDDVHPADVGVEASASANQSTNSRPHGSEPNNMHVNSNSPRTSAKLQQRDWSAVSNGAENSPRTTDSVKRAVQDGLKETISRMDVVQEQHQRQQVEAAASTAEIMQALANLNDALWTLVARVASVEEQNLRLHGIFLNGQACEEKTPTLVTRHRINGSQIPPLPPRQTTRSVLQSDRNVAREKSSSASISPTSSIPHPPGAKVSVLKGQSALDDKGRQTRRQHQIRRGVHHLVPTLVGGEQSIRSYEATGRDGADDQRENQPHSMRVDSAPEFRARSSSSNRHQPQPHHRREGAPRPAARCASPREDPAAQDLKLLQEHAKGTETHVYSNLPQQTRRNMSNDVVLTSFSPVNAHLLSTNDSRRLEHALDRPTSFSTTRTINCNG